MHARRKPPYTPTSAIERAVGDICEKVGRLSAAMADEQDLLLRRVNRIRTIQGSLAIEGNTLTEEQITAIINGKRVTAPPREIQEARNAFEAYERMEQWTPGRESDLLDAHAVMMAGLVDRPGRYRAGSVGVMSPEGVIHVAPPANRVPALMADLFDWLNRGERHPLVTSSIFHYEFEFIHPFEDGNGRIGRLWQTLILSRWNHLFAFLPVESMIHARQAGYYAALAQSTQRADTAPFVEFILNAIEETVDAYLTGQVAGQVAGQVKKMLVCLKAGPLGRREIMERMGLKGRDNFEKRYLHPAMEAGLVEMTVPEKPNSRLQKYRLTEKGQRIKESLENGGKP